MFWMPSIANALLSSCPRLPSSVLPVVSDNHCPSSSSLTHALLILLFTTSVEAQVSSDPFQSIPRYQV